jgi:hypothetical protein
MIQKLISTINGITDAVIAAPEALREARELQREFAERNGMPARLQRLIDGAVAKDKHIAELESTAKDAAAEINRLRANDATLRAEVARLESELASLRAKTGGPIQEPDVGDGWEFCAKDSATEACVLRDHASGKVWSRWSDMSSLLFNAGAHNYRFRRPITKPAEPPPPPEPGEGFELCEREGATHFDFRYSDGKLASGGWDAVYPGFDHTSAKARTYYFRRPIAKPATKWVPCTADEAEDSPEESQWLSGRWRNCDDMVFGNRACHFVTDCAYRTTAKLSDLVTVDRDTWRRAPLNAREGAEATGVGGYFYRLRRSLLPEGFRCG